MFNLFKNNNVIKGSRNEPLPLTHTELPDSYRPNGLCPRCGKQSSFENIGNLPVTFDGVSYTPSRGKTPTYSDRVIVLVVGTVIKALLLLRKNGLVSNPEEME